MKFTISPDQSKLTISADAGERAELQSMRADESAFFDSDNTLHDFFESLVCNSELQWINAEQTGDLTSAPMLAILGQEKHAAELPACHVLTGGNESSVFCQPILARWAFMDYQIKSPLADLLERGQCVFTGGRLA